MSKDNMDSDNLLASVLDHLELGDDSENILNHNNQSGRSTPSSVLNDQESHHLDPSLVSPSSMWQSHQTHMPSMLQHPDPMLTPNPMFAGFGPVPMNPQFHGQVSLDPHGNPIIPMHPGNPPVEVRAVEEPKEEAATEEKSDDADTKSPEANPKSSIRIKSLHLPLPKKKFKRISPKELADVIRLQIMGLMTKNPMDDDFYYQVYTAKQGEPWKGIGFPGEKSSGFKENIYRNPDGTPKLPSGTLGKIAGLSARKPRSLIQITSGASSTKSSSKEEGEKRMNMFITHSIPYLIEEGIRCLMNIEDVDGLLISSENPELYVQREKLGKQLLEHMGISDFDIHQYNPNHLVYKFAAYTKGRQLIIRSLLLLPQALAVVVFTILLGQLNLFSNPLIKSSLFSRSSDAFDQILKQCAPEEIVFVFIRFMNEENMMHAVEIMRSPVGSSIFKHFLKAGHAIRQNPMSPPPLVMEWINLFTAIYGTMPVAFKLSALFDPENEDYWENALDICMHANGNQIMQIRADAEFDHLTKLHLTDTPFASEIRKLVFDW